MSKVLVFGDNNWLCGGMCNGARYVGTTLPHFMRGLSR
jgi:hypothetical protein